MNCIRYIEHLGAKTLLFRWHKKFQDGFTNLKDGSRPGQPKSVVTNTNIAAVAGLIKRDVSKRSAKIVTNLDIRTTYS